jgi:glucuronokinase
MERVVAHAQARVGLLGNPSDLYGGRGLGFAVAELGVEVRLESGAPLEPLEPLFGAGWTRMRSELERLSIAPGDRPWRLTFASDIPFQSGLSGSSALLIAALRAWSNWYSAPLAPSRVAELAWRTENEDLGIRAGTLDRLVQAHGGLLAMDFARPFEPGGCKQLAPTLLPPMLLAWHGRGSTPSGDVHAPIFERFQSGDATVVGVMEAVAANADRGRAALEQGATAEFLACIDCNLELRRELFALSSADLELIALGRASGAAAKLPGSGGAVLFACETEAELSRVEVAVRAAGHTTLRPSVHSGGNE